MEISDIYTNWGATVQFNNPLEFFNVDKNFWRQLIYKRRLLVFKNMNFDILDFCKFGTYFGQPYKPEEYRYTREVAYSLEDNDQIKHYYTVFKSDEAQPKTTTNITIPPTEMPWHSDVPNHRTHPFPLRSLWVKSNPNTEKSGQTKWLNVEYGLDLLPGELKNLATRVKVLQQSWYKPGTDLQLHDLIKIHPITGIPSLRLNDYYKGKNENWIKKVYIDDQEQPDCSLIKTYIDALLEHRELFYQHRWETNDIVIYDNWSFLHGRTALDFDHHTNLRLFFRQNINHQTDQEYTRKQQIFKFLH